MEKKVRANGEYEGAMMMVPTKDNLEDWINQSKRYGDQLKKQTAEREKDNTKSNKKVTNKDFDRDQHDRQDLEDGQDDDYDGD